MTSQWHAGVPFAGGSAEDGDPYATWDAAYVLGALPSTERREFEGHLGECRSCREAVAELSGMPALLSMLDEERVLAIEAAGTAAGAVPALRPEVLTSLLAKVSWRRRRSRVMVWTAGSAAAAVLAVGAFVGLRAVSPAPAPTPPSSNVAWLPAEPAQPGGWALPMSQIGTTRLASTVSLRSEQWGTFIVLKCVCLAPPTTRHDTLAMVVVARDGSHSRLATWVAVPGQTALPGASTSLPVEQISAVQVVAADTGDVLLQRAL